MKIFPVLWRHPGVKGITLWGYLDGQMWQTTCYLVRSDGTARPALLWPAQYVKDNPVGIRATTSTLPSKFELKQNFPNPFNPATAITYQVAVTSRISLKVFNLLGQNVGTLVDATYQPGTYMAVFNGTGLPSSIYFCQMDARNRDGVELTSVVRKMLLVK
jgi:endo-1,4-beta-xylanase